MAQKGQEGSKKFFVWLRMQSTIYNSSEGGERSTSYPLPLSASSSYLASLMLQLYPNISEFDHLYFMKTPWKYSILDLSNGLLFELIQQIQMWKASLFLQAQIM